MQVASLQSFASRPVGGLLHQLLLNRKAQFQFGGMMLWTVLLSKEACDQAHAVVFTEEIQSHGDFQSGIRSTVPLKPLTVDGAGNSDDAPIEDVGAIGEESLLQNVRQRLLAVTAMNVKGHFGPGSPKTT